MICAERTRAGELPRDTSSEGIARRIVCSLQDVNVASPSGATVGRRLRRDLGARVAAAFVVEHAGDAEELRIDALVVEGSVAGRRRGSRWTGRRPRGRWWARRTDGRCRRL
jgi:hypothetical protein